MFRTIMVPLDGSPFGECALPLALSIARRAGATLQLVLVIPPPATIYTEAPVFVDNSFEEEVLAHQRATNVAYLQRTVEKLNKTAPVTIQTVVLEGDIAAMLRQQALRSSADLVVMTTHARGPTGRFWLGSVADDLMRKLPMPLVLVRPGEACTATEMEPQPRTILIPLDGQPLAEQAIEPAVELGSLMDASYILLRVINPVMPTVYPLEGAGMGQVAQSLIDRIEVLQKQVREEAEAYLENIAAGLRERGHRVLTRVEVEDRPALAILHQAETADLIAMSTHGRHGLSRLFVGSVADKVIRGGHVPVLVYRPVETVKAADKVGSAAAAGH